MSATARFHRLVLELGHGAADPATMREAAAFARLLDAELHALFVEDETLLHASALPFAREISPLSYRWRPLRPDRLVAELRAAADRARRQLEAVALAAGVRRSFEVRRGDLALHVSETCVASDIVVVAPPRGMGSEATHGSGRLRELVHRSAASALFLPRDAGRRGGWVVAVVTGASDPALAEARRIAARSREGLMVLTLSETEIDGDTTIRRLAGIAVADIQAAMGEARERLIVMTRGPPEDGHFEDGRFAHMAAMLAVARGVPVLMVEPI